MNRKHTSHPPLLSPSHAPRSPSLLTREALPAFLDLQRAKLMDADRDTLDSTPAVKDSGAGNSFLKCEVTLTPDTVTTDNQENWLVYGAAAGLYWPNMWFPQAAKPPKERKIIRPGGRTQSELVIHAGTLRRKASRPCPLKHPSTLFSGSLLLLCSHTYFY